MKIFLKCIIVFFLCFVIACKSSQFATQISTQESLFESWKMERFTELKHPTGWASVVGLYFLNKDSMSIGSLETNDIVFPEKAPSHLGQLIKEEDNFTFIKMGDYDVSYNGWPIDTCRMYGPSENEFRSLNFKSFYWFLIERDGQHYIRLKDTLSERRLALTSIPYFPFNKNMLINARIYREEQERYIPITNVLGVTAEKKVQGTINFKHKGEDHQLVALDGGPGKWFVIFADDTSGEETYGGGRFMDVTLPEQGDQIVLDFNRGYNPPCVFTDYATCPLPPPENRLPFSVLAGEKSMLHY